MDEAVETQISASGLRSMYGDRCSQVSYSNSRMYALDLLHTF